MKVQITGASNFVNRFFESCGNYQWAREFLTNALEANATRIEFGIEWQAVSKHGIYRRTIADNGEGMSSEKLLEFFSTLGAGAKKIGGVHDNFGVGAKIASLPWNPEGVVVISYKDGQASMIWIMLDPDSGDYELVEFETDDDKRHVIDPSQFGVFDDGIEWAAIKPDWIEEHGTIIVLLGSEEYPDTILGNPHAGEGTTKGLSIYLNSRFWDLSSKEVKVAELRSEKKSQWPESPDDTDDARRPNNRRIQGAKFYLVDLNGKQGQLEATDRLMLDDDRVGAEWYLWGGVRPQVHAYAREQGYIAVRYKGELYDLTYTKPHFRWFGIIESKVQQNLTIILDPQHFDPADGRWGVHPDHSRNRLVFTGNGEKGVALPMADWGTEFASNLPDPILEAIRAARGEVAGSIENEEYRRRLQEKFGKRWTMKALVKPRRNEKGREPATITEEETEVVEPHGTRRRRKTRKILRKLAISGGDEGGVEREIPVDVPKFRYAPADAFERPWHLATWVPNDPEGPTVVLNTDSPILEEIITYHQQQYPDVFSEEVGKVVQQVFGEIAACKVAHSQRLTKEIALEQLNNCYRSEEALTFALMGLIAEEAVVSQRLGRLGRKRSPSPSAVS